MACSEQPLSERLIIAQDQARRCLKFLMFNDMYTAKQSKYSRTKVSKSTFGKEHTKRTHEKNTRKEHTKRTHEKNTRKEHKMSSQYFNRYMNRCAQIGVASIVVIALQAPQLAYAHGTKAHGDKTGAEAQHAETKHGENSQSEEHTAEKSHAKKDHGGKHGHGLIDVSRWEYVPAISMEVEKDAVSGWNIQLMPHSFKFTPENVNKQNHEGEGHAHLFVDDKKVARVYGTWFHLPALSPGEHSIKIQLNANDHSVLAVGDNPIENISIIEQPE